MIRRTLTGGLLATVAILALVPTAAEAAPATHAVPRAAVSAAASNTSSAPAARPAHHVNHPATHGRSTHAYGRVVTHRYPLLVRSGPGTGYRVTGRLRAGSLVALRCRTNGSSVRGTHQWYRLAQSRGYVSAHYVRVVRGTLPWC
ncbi:SH3 domain-containing protein [Streptomyces sp. NPDC057197]|uniref:SH3 domain-containing protein n=1 Tax=Streptomyces sp. NPDC057197 TaxID=3346045 RepID=UPI00362F9264